MDIFGEVRKLRNELRKHINLSHDPTLLGAIDFIIESLIKIKEDSDQKHEEILSGLYSLGAKVQLVGEIAKNASESPQYISVQREPLSKTYYDEDEDSMYIPDIEFGESTMKAKDSTRDAAETDLVNDINSLSKLLGGK